MKLTAKNNLGSIIIALLLTLPVIFRGLFFAQDMFAFSAIVFLWLGVFCFLHKKNLKVESFLTIALLGLVISYFISSAFAASPYSALTEAVKYILFFLIYLAVKALFNDKEKIRLFFEVLIFTLSLSSVISLLTAAGVVNFPGAYSSSVIEKWLNGTVQYHNAFGALMLLGYFTASSINNKPLKSFSFALNGISSYLLMFGLIMSYSRGSWVFVPVLAVLLLIFAPHNTKIRFFATGISSLAGVISVLPFFTGYVDAQNKVMGLVMLIAGLVLSMILYYVLNILLEKISKLRYFKAISIITLALLVLVAILILFIPSLFAFLPERLAERLAGINLSSGTVKERFVFYNDAFKLYKDHNLLIGSGGSAWKYMYGIYQSYLYHSSQAHSYIMQVLVETGALGFIFWCATIILFYVQAFIAKKKETTDKNLLAAIVCSGSALILHSFIDFDLSLPAIMLILWCILALLDTSCAIKFKELVLSKILVCVLSVLLAVFCICGCIAHVNYQKATALKNADAPLELINTAYKNATTAMPINPEYKIAFLLNTNEEGYSITEDDVKDLVASDPYNKTMYKYEIEFYNILHDYKSCMASVEKVLALQPLNYNNYITYASFIVPVLQQYMSGGDFAGAQKKAEDILTHIDMLNEAAKNSEINADAINRAIEYAQNIAINLKGI